MREDEWLGKWEQTLSLLDAYEPLLSASQRETLTLYFRYNLSLGEIAEEKGISRAAIFDALKKGVAKLEKYESALHIAKKDAAVKRCAEQVKQSQSLEEAKGLVAALEEDYFDGI